VQRWGVDMAAAVESSVDDVRYRSYVDDAVQRGLSDCEAGRTFRHVPLVRRGDRRLTDVFQSVVWTASARQALEELFGKVFDAAAPRNHLLEQVLDKAAYALTNAARPVEVRSGIDELMLMWGHARLVYRVESRDVFVVAVVPSFERWRRMEAS